MGTGHHGLRGLTVQPRVVPLSRSAVVPVSTPLRVTMVLIVKAQTPRGETVPTSTVRAAADVAGRSGVSVPEAAALELAAGLGGATVMELNLWMCHVTALSAWRPRRVTCSRVKEAASGASGVTGQSVRVTLPSSTASGSLRGQMLKHVTSWGVKLGHVTCHSAQSPAVGHHLYSVRVVLHVTASVPPGYHQRFAAMFPPASPAVTAFRGSWSRMANVSIRRSVAVHTYLRMGWRIWPQVAPCILAAESASATRGSCSVTDKTVKVKPFSANGRSGRRVVAASRHLTMTPYRHLSTPSSTDTGSA